MSNPTTKKGQQQNKSQSNQNQKSKQPQNTKAQPPANNKSNQKQTQKSKEEETVKEDLQQNNEKPVIEPESKPKQGSSKNNKKAESKNQNPNQLYGVCPNGTTFPLAKTKSAIHFSLPHQWTLFEWVKYIVCAFHLSFLYFDAPIHYYVVSFVFWRFGYNLGIGCILHKQSTSRAFTGWFRTLKLGPWAKRVVSGEMPSDYKFDNYPPEFNSWLLFRGIAEVILAADLFTYGLMCWRLIDLPEEFTVWSIVTYSLAIFLALFALWAKFDAYRVIKDYAWFWGDFFFLVDQKLVFNRVFSLFPHPMYTVGYAFFYSAWLISQNETVLYVSLFGHFCQLVFLHFVETPHIEKTYPEMVREIHPTEKEVLFNEKTGYYRKDLIGLYNLDLMRSSDVFLILSMIYVAILHVADVWIGFYIGHAIIWRLFHSGVLGWVLWKQSNEDWWNKRWDGKRTKQHGFEEWKRLYNSSTTMCYVSMISVAIKLADIDQFGRFELLRFTFGLLLIALNIWSSISTFEVLGENGWFYGDFFIKEIASKLYYTGIYRYLNNPDSTTGFAGFYGLFIMSGNWIILALSVFSHACHLLFLTYVEVPHMKSMYGDQLREKAGFQEGVRAILDEEKVAIKAKVEKVVEESKKHAEKVVQEVKRRVISRSNSMDSF